MRRVFVAMPEQPNVEQFVRIDQPGIIYINTCCTTKGVTVLIMKFPSDSTQEQA